jgi:DNA polymerase-1
MADLSRRILGREKGDALPKLKRKYKGYDRIPVDDPEYVEYAKLDAELTSELTEALQVPDPDYLARERRVAALAASLTVRGVRVDVELLEARVAEREAHTAELQAKLVELGFPEPAGPTSVPWRSKESVPVWNALLAEAMPGYEWPQGANGAPLTGRAELEDILTEIPGESRLGEAVRTVLEIGRSGSSFVYQVRDALAPDGRIHPEHKIVGKGDEEGGATGRWSTATPNILGVGKRSKELKEERRILLPEPGDVFLSIDLAGIDARAVAGLSGDEAYAELMAPGVDIHLEIAEIFFGERTPEARSQIKPYTHGIPYGRAAATLAKDIVKRPGRFEGRDWASVVPEMTEYLSRYYARFPGILEWQKKVRSLCEGNGVIDNGFGRGIRTAAGWEYTQAPSRQAQSCARDLAMEGLLRIKDAGLWDTVRMFVHDEVVLSVPEAQALELGARVAELMSFDWDSPSGLVIPVIAQFDGTFGPTWADAY